MAIRIRGSKVNSITDLREVFEEKRRQLDPVEKYLNEEGLKTLEFCKKIGHEIVFYRDGEEVEFLKDDDVINIVNEYAECEFVKSFIFWSNRYLKDNK